MVKGVNKSVIEITDTGNRYFSKIILFVSPQYANNNSRKLSMEAGEIVRNLHNSDDAFSLRKAVARERKRRKKVLFCLMGIGIMLLVAGVLAVIL
ncbi:MAG: hypothetical protein U0M42_06220 [Acutalibacteraceae bacterium]|nr:hypothetical protein [Acutalibacteraceae bacterium]